MFSMIHRGFICAHDLADPVLARAYCNARAHDAVQCYREGNFVSVVQLAQHLATYW